MRLRKFLAGVVSFVFLFSNIAFAYKPQDNLWKERKSSQSVQLAALPASAGLPGAFPLPSIKSSLRATRDALPLLAGVKKSIHDLPAKFLSHVNIRETRRVAGAPQVILIEDVHQNLEAQSHID